MTILNSQVLSRFWNYTTVQVLVSVQVVSIGGSGAQTHQVRNLFRSVCVTGGETVTERIGNLVASRLALGFSFFVS